MYFCKNSLQIQHSKKEVIITIKILPTQEKLNVEEELSQSNDDQIAKEVQEEEIKKQENIQIPIV